MQEMMRRASCSNQGHKPNAEPCPKVCRSCLVHRQTFRKCTIVSWACFVLVSILAAPFSAVPTATAFPMRKASFVVSSLRSPQSAIRQPLPRLHVDKGFSLLEVAGKVSRGKCCNVCEREARRRKGKGKASVVPGHNHTLLDLLLTAGHKTVGSDKARVAHSTQQQSISRWFRKVRSSPRFVSCGVLCGVE